MKRNTEWWWTESYSQDGEVGDQADWDGSSLYLLMLKKLFGISWRKSEQQKNKQETGNVQ